jgi:DNA-binding response OmpR family regulator
MEDIQNTSAAEPSVPEPTIKSQQTQNQSEESPKPETEVAPKVVNNENGHRVLLVEDDQFLRELLDRKLKSEGFNVQTAIEGESALAQVKEFKPEIVLLDIILPGTDGFSILEQLKSDDEVSKTPVVMLSNLGQKDDVDKGMKLGAVGYLVKAHFTPGDIVAKVNEILNLK